MKDSISTRNLFAVISLLLVFVVTTHTPSDADMWWHLRAGEEMVRRGQILTQDVFSYTRSGATWINAFWLSDLGMYGLYRLGGLGSLSIASSLLGVITFGIILLREPKISFLSAGSVILSALAAAPFWSPRPQLMSFLFLALLDYWITEVIKGKGPPLWLMPMFFALWANLHGGFIWGILLLIAYLAGELLEILIYRQNTWSIFRNLLLWTVISIPAIILNPNGIALWGLPFTTLKVSLIVQEWQSPDFHQLTLHPALWLLLLLFIATGFNRNRSSIPDLIKVTGFAYLAFIAQRNIAPLAIVAAPVLISTLTNASNQLQNTPLGDFLQQRVIKVGPPEISSWLKKSINLGLVGIIAFGAAIRVAFLAQPAEIQNGYPTQAVEWLQVHPQSGHLFNSYNWGGYLLWTLPEIPVFIDGRTDLYGNDLTQQWQDVVNAKEDAFNILDKWQVRTILLEPGWPILGQLAAHGWMLSYQDSTAVIWTR